MITVIADDLTGAAEIAGVCIRYGLDVAFGIDSIPQKKLPLVSLLLILVLKQKTKPIKSICN